MQRQQTLIPPPLSGVHMELGPDQLSASMLRSARNVLGVNGRVQLRPGLTKRTWGTKPGDRAMGAIQYDLGATSGVIVVGTITKWWKYNPSTDAWADISDPAGALTGGGDSLVSFRVLEVSGTPTLLGVNCTNAPKVWTGTGTYATVTGLPPGALTSPVAIAVAANRVLLAEGHKVYVSGDGVYSAGWSDHVANLNQTPGDIVSMLEMGPTALAVYKEDAIYLATALTGTVPFRYDMAAAGIPGPVGPKAVVALPDGTHAYLARNGAVYVFDGSRAMEMPANVRAYVASCLSADRMWRTHGFYQAELGRLWFVFPRTGSSDPNGAVVIDMQAGVSDSPVVVWEQYWPTIAPTTSLPILLKRSKLLGELPGMLSEYAGIKLADFNTWTATNWMLGSDGAVYDLSGDTDNGAAISGWLEWGGLGLDFAGWKTLHELEVACKSTQESLTGTLEVGLKELGDNMLDAVSDTVALGGTGRKRMFVRRSARLFQPALELSSSKPFALDGLLATWTPRGWR